MDDPVRLVTTVATPTAVVAEATTWEEFPRVWQGPLNEVWAFVRESGLTAGRNVMLYRDHVPNVEVGVEVNGACTGNGRVVASSLPAGHAAMVVQRGAPNPARLARAHVAVREWCTASGLTLNGTRWEIHGHWLEDQDPALFETEVYWLLEPRTAEQTCALEIQ